MKARLPPDITRVPGGNSVTIDNAILFLSKYHWVVLAKRNKWRDLVQRCRCILVCHTFSGFNGLWGNSDLVNPNPS